MVQGARHHRELEAVAELWDGGSSSALAQRRRAGGTLPVVHASDWGRSSPLCGMTPIDGRLQSTLRLWTGVTNQRVCCPQCLVLAPLPAGAPTTEHVLLEQVRAGTISPEEFFVALVERQPRLDITSLEDVGAHDVPSVRRLAEHDGDGRLAAHLPLLALSAYLRPLVGPGSEAPDVVLRSATAGNVALAVLKERLGI